MLQWTSLQVFPWKTLNLHPLSIVGVELLCCRVGSNGSSRSVQPYLGPFYLKLEQLYEKERLNALNTRAKLAIIIIVQVLS